MRFTFLGVRFLCTVPFCVLISGMLLLDVTGYMLLSLLAVVTHELGHLVAMWRLRSAPGEVRLSVYGVTIFKNPYSRPVQELWVAAAGPLANLLFALVLFGVYLLWPVERVGVFGLIHLVVAGFNLLPARGLDGGTLLLAGLQTVFGAGRGQKMFSVVSVLFAGVVAAAGVTLLFVGGANLSLLCIGIYLLILNILKI